MLSPRFACKLAYDGTAEPYRHRKAI